MNTCLHCGETFQREFEDAIGGIATQKPLKPFIVKRIPYVNCGNIYVDDDIVTFYLDGGICPKCNKTNIVLNSYKFDYDRQGFYEKTDVDLFFTVNIYPAYSKKQLSNEIPKQIANDYLEALRISNISTKASATLSRRCLQATIRHKFPEMGKKPNLKQEIDWVIENGNLDAEINEVLHKLRDAGNFGAHPSEDGLTEIYDLSQEDLEACFLLLDHLFDIFYVQPAKRKEKLAKLKNIPSSKK